MRVPPTHAAAALALALAACSPSAPTPAVPGPGPGPTPTSAPGPNPGMANPASKNCLAKGGKLEIRSDAAGNETGFCVFPDGSSCDEWAFMDGKCAPGQKR